LFSGIYYLFLLKYLANGKRLGTMLYSERHPLLFSSKNIKLWGISRLLLAVATHPAGIIPAGLFPYIDHLADKAVVTLARCPVLIQLFLG
jgi:hypothetical protein